MSEGFHEASAEKSPKEAFTEKFLDQPYGNLTEEQQAMLRTHVEGREGPWTTVPNIFDVTWDDEAKRIVIELSEGGSQTFIYDPFVPKVPQAAPPVESRGDSEPSGAVKVGEKPVSVVTQSNEALRTVIPGGEWIDLSGKKIVTDQAGLYSGKELVMKTGAANTMNFVGKYNFHEGTMIVGGPDGSLHAAPYSAEREEALKSAGYKQEFELVPSLTGHQRFEDEETQRAFEALKN